MLPWREIHRRPPDVGPPSMANACMQILRRCPPPPLWPSPARRSAAPARCAQIHAARRCRRPLRLATMLAFIAILLAYVPPRVAEATECSGMLAAGGARVGMEVTEGLVSGGRERLRAK